MFFIAYLLVRMLNLIRKYINLDISVMRHLISISINIEVLHDHED